ncbi:hypothetical protein [Nonomuraea typhae]|uniref:Uncharacterized protein n=1 Tax=Nonomuraea typhae TaxID=2603600 RepID=A0ABW7Z626_9ACTN
MTQRVTPLPGMWFEHALHVPQDDSPAWYVIIEPPHPTSTAFLQIHYRHLRSAPGSLPESIDADLFDDIVLRWLTPEESAQAQTRASFEP